MTNKRLQKGLKRKQNKINKIIAKIWNNDFGYLHSLVYFVSKTFVKTANKMVFARKYAFNTSLIMFIGVVGVYFFFPAMVKADIENAQIPMNHKTVDLMINEMENETKQFGELPVSKNAKPFKTIMIPITAYTSEVAQTDDTPCITASGLDVCKRNTEDIVAANFLPIGTKVKIPEVYGDRVFIVQDRMNKRYDKHMDVWLKDLKAAKQFGLKYTKIEIY